MIDAHRDFRAAYAASRDFMGAGSGLAGMATTGANLGVTG